MSAPVEKKRIKGISEREGTRDQAIEQEMAERRQED